MNLDRVSSGHDLPNDFKFQYVGTVYRDLDTGHAPGRDNAGCRVDGCRARYGICSGRGRF